jgi:GntR family transcriptional regulator
LPEIQSVLPKYLQIAGHIRDQIVRGDLRPGDEVPSERELAAVWHVARPTASRALQALRLQGLVESRQGAGTFVRAANAVPRARERYDRARELGTMYGRGEKLTFVATDLVTAPAHVAQALRLPAGAQAIRRARLLLGHGNRPIELSTSWFDGSLSTTARGLLRPVGLPGGTAKYVAGLTGRAAAFGRDQVAARLATAEECQHLQLVPPAAVLIYQLSVFAADDEPIQFDEAVYPPDQWVLGQEYPLVGPDPGDRRGA